MLNKRNHKSCLTRFVLIVFVPAYAKFSYVIDKRADYFSKVILIYSAYYCSLISTHPSEETDRKRSENYLRKQAYSVGPQTWRHYVFPGFHWLACCPNKYPTAEWKAFVEDLIKSIKALSPTEQEMFLYKCRAVLHGDRMNEFLAPDQRRLANW